MRERPTGFEHCLPGNAGTENPPKQAAGEANLRLSPFFFAHSRSPSPSRLRT